VKLFMRIGIDLDNTIVCYDEVFRRLAVERFDGDSIAASAVKDHLRSTLRAAGREDEWTELQGAAYGPGMKDAVAFPGVGEFLARCRKAGADVCIISHRSRTPYRGPPYDLHEAARNWLSGAGLWSEAEAPPVFLELSKEEKIARIASQRCTHFIDDLPELLAESAFPDTVVRILFDPHRRHENETRFMRVGSWRELDERLFLQ